MAANRKNQRYIYMTRGVCPPEIHFKIDQGFLSDVRFVGGGCPGNAQLVARLLRGRPIDEVLQFIGGIECRDGTSCPQQLGVAIQAALDGRLTPADCFRLYADSATRQRVGLVGDLAGNTQTLKRAASGAAAEGVAALYCLGNLTGEATHDEIKQLLKTISKLRVVAIQGEADWNIAGRIKDRHLQDGLIQLPQVLTFRLADKKCVAFYGDYILNLPGFSDFGPFALEMNMVCGLTDFMQDDSVFPALEAMIPQFQADVVLFGQVEQWGHWQVGGKDFIGVGPAAGTQGQTWGLLEVVEGRVRLEVMRTSRCPS